jgi:nucleotide-binding universal stress UspA family protein
MRVYLVIMDETDESIVALRFATRRAIKTEGQVHILATIEEEARARAETVATAAAGSVMSEAGLMPVICVGAGDPIKVVQTYLAQHPEVAALVLGATAQGTPGPLISHFTGAGIGALPCPLFIVPGGMSEAEIDRLS